MLNDTTRTLIENTLNEHEVVLFMKGTAQFPVCGFSGYVVQALNKLNIPFKSINVLEDQELREGIKVFTDWPTIPQLYVKKEFVGGADIVREMYESGELANYFKAQGIEENPAA